MKTKFTFILFICIMLASCTHDDDETVLTEDNYIFEGDLYKYALNVQIDSLIARQNYLQEIINNNQGNEQIKADLAATSSLKNETITIEGAIPSLDYIIDVVALRIPRPPGPRPGVIPISWAYLVFYDLKEYNGVLFDASSKMVGQTANSAKAVKGTDEKLQAVKIDLSGVLLPGSYLLNSKRVDVAGNQASYTNELSVNGK